MSSYLDRAIDALMVVISTIISVQFIAPEIHKSFPSVAQAISVPVVSAALYLFIALLVGLIRNVEIVRRAFDRCRAIYIGQYLSFPSNSDHVGIFRIYFDSSERKYKLEGTSYSIQGATSIGSWNSSVIDMSLEDRRLAYIYRGSSFPGGAPNDLHGYSIIRFDHADLLTGKGRYTDDAENRTPVNSSYWKVTRDLTSDIIGRRVKRISDREVDNFLQKLSVLPVAKRRKYRSQTGV